MESQFIKLLLNYQHAYVFLALEPNLSRLGLYCARYQTGKIRVIMSCCSSKVTNEQAAKSCCSNKASNQKDTAANAKAASTSNCCAASNNNSKPARCKCGSGCSCAGCNNVKL